MNRIDDEHCVALVNIDTVFGVIPFAEHIHVVNGQLVSIRGYCNPRPILAQTIPTSRRVLPFSRCFHEEGRA